MKNLTTIAKERNTTYNQLKETLNNLNILQGSSATKEAIERGIAESYTFNNGIVGKTYFKYDDQLIDKYITDDQHLPKPIQIAGSWSQKDFENGNDDLPF